MGLRLRSGHYECEGGASRIDDGAGVHGDVARLLQDLLNAHNRFIRMAKRPGSVDRPISEAALWAEMSLMLILFSPFGWPVVSSRSPSQRFSQIWPAAQRDNSRPALPMSSPFRTG